jgi:hypothetical protein
LPRGAFVAVGNLGEWVAEVQWRRQSAAGSDPFKPLVLAVPFDAREDAARGRHRSNDCS